MNRKGEGAAFHLLAEATIGGHPAADEHSFGADLLRGGAGSVQKLRNDRALETGEQTEGLLAGDGEPLLFSWARRLAEQVLASRDFRLRAARFIPAEDGSLQSTEAEVLGVAAHLG